MNKMSKNTVTWREDYEPFRGRVWTFGHYKIVEQSPTYRGDGPCYVAYHSGQRISTSTSLYELQLACEERLTIN